MAKTDGFPWSVFSANTLRPMVSDIFRSNGMPLDRLDKEESIALLQKIEKHGLDTALKDITTTGKKNASASAPPGANASGSGSAKRKRKETEQVDAAPPVASASGRVSTRAKRKHEEPELDDADNGAASEQRVSTRAKRKHEEPELKDTDIGTAATGGRTSTRAKRKRDEPDVDNGAAAPRKRAPGRSRKAGPETETVSSPVSPRRGRNSDPGEGLLTRRQAAQARGESIPTRSWKSTSRTRKISTAGAPNGTGDSVSAGSKPKSKGVFDGVEIVKRPQSFVGKGKEREIEAGDDGSDVDAEGEVVDDGMEQETGTSSLENSNKENEATITDLANEETDADVDAEGEDVFIIPDEIGSPVPQSASEPADEAQLNYLVAIDRGSPPPVGTVGEDCLLPDGSSVPHSASKSTDEEAQLNHLVTIDGGSPPPENTMSEDLPLPEHIGSPAPQITVEPTDDQIEEARLNQDVSMDIGSPAPEIRIEPIADDGEEIEFEENGFSEEGGLLRVRPQIDIARAGTPLNPEYSIEVFSPGSAQHDSDDETWVTSGMNGNSEGLRAAGGGLDALD
ncbi:hypothetical protein DFH06DRAFT_1225942 [Mycena polygramma]|nr:hypothetical protein DFH06DRAFT_1225942 [Mycena polygramma]